MWKRLLKKHGYDFWKINSWWQKDTLDIEMDRHVTNLLSFYTKEMAIIQKREDWVDEYIIWILKHLW